jgi:tetratricopeptide (TPR) repeat protein
MPISEQSKSRWHGPAGSASAAPCKAFRSGFGVAAAGLLMAATGVPPAAAQTAVQEMFNVARVSAAEWAMLPEYCPDTQTYQRGGTQGYEAWIARMGPGFTALHHYCWGLIKASRAGRPGLEKQVRNGLYGSAIEECNYVLRNSPPDFVLRPEVLLRAGQWSAAAEAYARALEYFEESIQAKPDYWPPYLEIANVNLGLRRRQHAIDALERGLKVMPQQEQLTAALKRIQDGKSPPAGRSARP